MPLGLSAKCVIWLLAILFTNLLLPMHTHGLTRDLCKGSEGGAACAESSAADLIAGRKLTARQASGRKFKFHKIERLDEDDDDDNNDEDDDEDENENDNDNEIDNNNNDDTDNDDDEDVAAEEDDDDDDDNVTKKRSKSKTRRAKQNANDDENNNDNDNDNDNDDDDADDNANDQIETKPNLVSRLLSIFTGDSETETEKEKKKEKEKEKAESQFLFQYTNVLSWLQGLTGDSPKVGKKEKKPKENVDNDIDWLTYLKRWPFNSIFPETPRSITQRRTTSKIDQEARQTEATRRQQQQQQQLKSEEYMELLIYSLPAFIGNVSQAQSGECHKQLELLHQQLHAHKLWTLQMLDATGKIGAGLLRGNINQFGDFDQCIQVSTAIKVASGKPKRLTGKYCLAQIEMRSTVASLKEPLHLLQGRGLWHAHLKNPKHLVPRYSIANWGICLPHACSAHVVHSIIETSLRPYNDTGIEFHIDVRDEHCTTKQRKNFMKLLSKDNNLAIGIFSIGALGAACLLATICERWDWISAQLSRFQFGKDKAIQSDAQETDPNDGTEDIEETHAENENAENPKEDERSTTPLHLRILSAFSPQRTLQSLVSLDGCDVEFPLIHALKIFATLMIYVNLKFIMAGHLPLTNRDAFVNQVSHLWSLSYRVPLLYSDLLLMLSGFLVAHQLSHEMEQYCRLSFLRNVAKKATRYVPSILAVIGFQTWILPHLGSGPLWNLLVGENARLCEENMWRNALSIQNTGDLEEMCSPITMQVSLDVQLYLLGALVVWLYFTDPEAGFYLCGAFHAASIAARYARTERDHLAPALFHGIHVSKFYRTANQIYASPITRATSYLLGIGAGLLFRSENGIFNMPARFRRTGWTLAVLAVVWCFWSPAGGMRSKFVYNSSEAAAYLAWSPLILGLGICWSILMMPLNKTARSLLFLSRMQIPLQLASYVIVLWNTASVKEPRQFQITDLINPTELSCIVLFAILIVFLIDFPAQQIGHLIIDYIITESLLPNVKETADTTNPTEAENSSTDVKSDSPEPIESIWSSDTDADEDK